ncbi:MAG TPA: D-sedoheptulose 7-phosphate isomerase [Gammaproteobacteria bacterium]|nr:D-sedoheptulose 7-phosphate isomerase [Gammaproteobacteria bacterium]
MSHLTLDYIKQNIRAAVELKQAILRDERLLRNILEAAASCVRALKAGNKLLFAGNGGSAGDAQHLAAEIVGRYKFDRPGLPAIALTTDTSALTAIGNDYGYEAVFERQLQALGRAGDVFFGISTSGNSKNVLRALERAREMKIVNIGLAGSGGAIQQLCEHCLSVPSTDTARIQECHIMIGQIICGYIEETMFPGHKH